MCGICGCSKPATLHDEHSARFTPLAAGSRVIRMEQQVLAKNDRLAEHNRSWFRSRGMLALNYGFELRSPTLWLINAIYATAGLAIAGAIIGGWQKKS